MAESNRAVDGDWPQSWPPEEYDTDMRLVDFFAQDDTVVIVTHDVQRAARISDQTAVFLTGGRLVEYRDTDQVFENPRSQRVEDYISGKFG